jgi:hypothetical protein
VTPFVRRFRVWCYHVLKLSETIDTAVDPRYDCDHCGPHNRHVRDETRLGDCPACPLTTTRARLWDTRGADARSLYEDWATHVGEGDPRQEAPELASTLAAVVDACALLPEGQTVDPRWTPTFAALVAAYRAEAAYLRREARWRLRPEA